MTPIPRSLLPDSAEVVDGRLFIGGMDVLELADEDLEGAMTPAYWLSRHQTVGGIPVEWQDHIVSMRKAALEVGAATDLESARAAAERISESCQGCHTAAGVRGPG